LSPAKRVRTLLLCLALLGCDARRDQAPDWVRSAPAAAVMAVSFRSDWALEQPRLRTLLEPFPLAGRSLDLFLTRARVNLKGAGRLTVYLARSAAAAAPGEAVPAPGFVMALSGFQDHGGLQVAIADAFPVSGAQTLDNRDRPQFVILDLGPSHIRASADGEGRLWLGEETALAGLDSGSGPDRAALAASAAWISGTAAIQGFIRPPELLTEVAGQLPGELARDLPAGIEALVWGVSPGPAPDLANGFELSLSGSEHAIQRAAAWLQRFLAAASAVPGAPAPSPEILQESRRISLRCQLSQEQLDLAMAKLSQPPLPRPSAPASEGPGRQPRP